MTDSKTYAVVAIPLNRPPVVAYLLPPQNKAQGQVVEIIGQRPTPQAEMAWLKTLTTKTAPQVADVLTIDNPLNNLVKQHTNRLIPHQFLKERDFLTRNLGGWSAIYFGVMGVLPLEVRQSDPLLSHLEILQDYGPQIAFFGADAAQVAARLETETGGDLASLIAAYRRLYEMRQGFADDLAGYVDRIYALLAGEEDRKHHVHIPRMVLFDALMGGLVRWELARRAAQANEDRQALTLRERQLQIWREGYGLQFILKGEYIAGRHRRSTVVIAPQLGGVLKQPAPEPFHEIALNARSAFGQAENWPQTMNGGAVVTGRGRLRLVVEENLIPKLSKVLGHKVEFSTLLGLTLEAFVAGQTIQEYVLADPRRMTLALYEEFILHQQVCERLGGENGDWHSANFVRNEDGSLVHIDWGAARPLRADEHTPEARWARLNQVQNIAYSFHNDALADIVAKHHATLLADTAHLERIQARARQLIEAAGERVVD